MCSADRRCFMSAIIASLCHLQELEMGSHANVLEITEQIGGLRQAIPAPMLAHYDRLRARGKKGVSLVRNQVCAECHVRVAIGVLATLRQASDLQVCGNCGRYLQLAPEDSAVPAPAASAPKAAKKKRRSRF